MRKKTVIKKLLQSVTEVYYKVWQLLSETKDVKELSLLIFSVRRNKFSKEDVV